MKIESPNAYLTDKELTTKYRKLAAKADARIRRIESKIGQAKFKGIENYAYKAVKKMISPIIGLSDGKPRFDRDISRLSRGQKEAMVGHVEQFIDFDTSTLRGYNKVWADRTGTFNTTFSNKDHTINVSVEEYRYLWESEQFNEMVEEYGYRDAFDSVMLNLQDGLNMKDAIEMAAFNKTLKTAYKAITNPLDKEMQKLTEQYNNLYGNFEKDLKEAEDFNKVMLGIQYRTTDAEFNDILNSLSDKQLLLFEGQLIRWKQEDALATLNELKK